MSASPRVLAAIAVGGACGSALRYGVGLAYPDHLGAGFPRITFAINVLGCLAIGVLATVLDRLPSPHPLLRPALGVGLLGGFTTFSTYADQARALAGSGHLGIALIYVVGTLAAALPAVRVGARLTDWVLRRVSRFELAPGESS